jgi:xanthine dehydrogenase accessory factor
VSSPDRLLVVIRGAGDLATGVAWRLRACGVAVVALELPEPLTVRRTVALSSAVVNGEVVIESDSSNPLIGVAVSSFEEARRVALEGLRVPVLVSPSLPEERVDVVVDARLAKSALDCAITDAPLVIVLGPGFTIGVHCHAAVETQRGPRLGRVLWEGTPEPNTGSPGEVGGRGVERVIRNPVDGVVTWQTDIGDVVKRGQTLGLVSGKRQRIPVIAPFTGVVRGLIANGSTVKAKTKIGDVDPRLDVNPHEISDKALAIGGGVVEALFTRARR